MTTSLRFAFRFAAAPLALALAACGSSGGDAGSDPLKGEAIAAIPAPDGKSWLEVASKTPEGGFVIGNPDAPLKLVEFASHTCGTCAYFSQNGSAPLQEKYVETGRVSYEIRPLLRDPVDVAITTLAQCGAPESFHALSDQAWAELPKFFETLKANPSAYEAAMQAPPEQRFLKLAQAAGLIEFFASRGLSADQAQSCLTDAAKIDAIATTSRTAADADQVSGTPTFFLNGQRLDVNQWDKLEPILQTAGAR